MRLVKIEEGVKGYNRKLHNALLMHINVGENYNFIFMLLKSFHLTLFTLSKHSRLWCKVLEFSEHNEVNVIQLTEGKDENEIVYERKVQAIIIFCVSKENFKIWKTLQKLPSLLFCLLSTAASNGCGRLCKRKSLQSKSLRLFRLNRELFSSFQGLVEQWIFRGW